jgi:hypothetical protein
MAGKIIVKVQEGRKMGRKYEMGETRGLNLPHIHKFRFYHRHDKERAVETRFTEASPNGHNDL